MESKDQETDPDYDEKDVSSGCVCQPLESGIERFRSSRVVRDSGYEECRRNFVFEGIELNWIAFGRELKIGAARLRGVKYCDPCARPSVLLGKERIFKEAFFDRGGIILEVIESGIIREGDIIAVIEEAP